MPTVNLPSLAEMKERIKNRNEAKASYKSTVDKDFYPFWEMETGGDGSTVRILPDIDPDNPNLFYVERDTHKLPIDGKDYTIVCPKTFGRTNECPICSRSQHYYNVENNAEMGKLYWRHRSSIVRLLILDGNIPSLVDEEGKMVDYTGRVCNSLFGNQIIKTIDDQIADLDPSDPNPFGLDDGFDFLIKKVASGKYNDYGFSKFVRHNSGIDPKYRDNLELIELKTLLPEQPSLDQVQHFLDAHDGAVEYNGARSDNDSKTEAKTEARTEAKPEARTEAKPEAKSDNVAQLSSSTSADDDRAMINDIINRLR